MTTIESACSAPFKGPAELLAHGCGAGVRGIDVEPGARLPAQLGDLRDRIDRGRRGRTRRGHDRGRAVDLRGEGIGTHAELFVHGTSRHSSPTSRAAFATEKFACSEVRTTPPGRNSRAAASAAIVAVEAVSSI